jgi:hypothetical protein
MFWLSSCALLVGFPVNWTLVVGAAVSFIGSCYLVLVVQLERSSNGILHWAFSVLVGVVPS